MLQAPLRNFIVFINNVADYITELAVLRINYVVILARRVRNKSRNT